jgi:endoglucanase
MRLEFSRTGLPLVLRRAFWLFCVALALSVAAWTTLAKAQGADRFHRGVALFHPLIHAPLEPGPGKRYAFPPFSNPRDRLTDAQLSVITKAGFDFVRLPVDPGPFLQFKGAQRDAVDAILRDRVQQILAAGLSVIVDFHPVTADGDYGSKALVQGIDTPLFNAYGAMLARTAKLLAALGSDRVALELLNEPPAGWNQAGFEKWQGMAEKLYRSARDAAPQLTLVLTGGSGSNYQGLPALDPAPFAKDPALIFTFHYYFPYEFTMQAQANNTTRSILFDVPYPSNARPMSDSLSALSAHLDQKHTSLTDKAGAIARATALLATYEAKGFDRSTIRANFDQVAVWAKTNGIPPSRILLGEFGVIRRHDIYQGARDDERAAWLRDIREEAETHGFIWSLWAYSGSGGMEITDPPDWTDIDPVTLKALGLR